MAAFIITLTSTRALPALPTDPNQGRIIPLDCPTCDRGDDCPACDEPIVILETPARTPKGKLQAPGWGLHVKAKRPAWTGRGLDGWGLSV